MPDSVKIDTSICNIESLPCPPHVAMKVVQLSNEPDKGVRDLCDVLALDAALCTSILRIANSTAYSRGRQFDDILQAVSVMGTKATAAIALGFSLKKTVPAWSHPSGLSDAILWRHSVACAVAARSIARLACYAEEQRAFLTGLLSRIGQLVLVTSAADAYGKVLDQSTNRFPLPEFEQEICGINHHVVGHYLLDSWNLPKPICDAVQFWNDPSVEALDEDTKTLASIITVADAVAEMLSGDDKGACLARIHQLARDLLGISTGEIERMFEHSEKELIETLAIFGDSAGSEIDCDALLAEGRQRLVEMSIELASDLAAAQSSTKQLEQANLSLERTANTDALTGLPNRAALTSEANAIWECYQHNRKRHFSVIMADVDHFKSFNDTHGHKIGDEVLIAVGKSLQGVMRGTDFVARYGGEEFTILLTNACSADAVVAAERFRAAVEETVIDCDGKSLRVTASFGGASSDLCPNAESFEAMLEHADQQLYVAKKAGRNRVAFAPSASPGAPVSADTPTVDSSVDAV